MTYFTVYAGSTLGKTYKNYVLQEVNKGDTETTGIVYATKEYPLTIKVSDAGNGNLTVDVTLTNGGVASFENRYEADGTGRISGTKILTGHRQSNRRPMWLASSLSSGRRRRSCSGRSNEHCRRQVHGNSEQEFQDRPGRKGDLLTVHTGGSSKDIQELCIERSPGCDRGRKQEITYDPAEYSLTIDVSDAGTGKLIVDVALSSGGTAEFTNEYHASGEAKINLHKNLTGRPTELQPGEFWFAIEEIIKAEDGTESRVPVTADGQIS